LNASKFRLPRLRRHVIFKDPAPEIARKSVIFLAIVPPEVLIMRCVPELWLIL
jgi:hypothetical protein